MHLSKEINKALAAVIVAQDGLRDDVEIQRYNNSGAPIFSQEELNNLICDELLFDLRLIGGLYNESTAMRGGAALTRRVLQPGRILTQPRVTRSVLKPDFARTYWGQNMPKSALKINAATRKGANVTNTQRAALSKALQKNSKLRSITAITKNIVPIQQKIKELRLNSKGDSLEFAELVSKLPGFNSFKIKLKTKSLSDIHTLWTMKYNSLLYSLNLLDHITTMARQDKIIITEFIDKTYNTGVRSSIQSLIRNFAGNKAGEHSYPAEEFTNIFVEGAFYNMYPDMPATLLLLRNFKATIRPLEAKQNYALYLLYVEANGLRSKRSLGWYDSMVTAYTNIKPDTKVLLEKIGLEQIFSYREDAFMNFVLTSIRDNIDSPNEYVTHFIGEALSNFEGRPGFDAIKLIRDAGLDAEPYLPRAKGGASLLRSALTRAPLMARTALARPVYARPSAFTRAFATRPPPSDARIQLKDFSDLDTGPSLKKLLPEEAIEKLGLKKMMPIAIVKEIVFKHMVSQGKIAGPNGQIELAALRYKMAALRSGKSSEEKTTMLEGLRAEESRLLALYGEAPVSLRRNKGLVESGQGDEALEMSTSRVESAIGDAKRGLSDPIAIHYAEKNAANEVLEDSADDLCAKSSSMASEAAIEQEVLSSGVEETSRVASVLLGVTPSVGAAAAKESTKVYADLFGKVPPILTTKAGLAASGKALPAEDSAVGLLGQVKAFTPYGRALANLSTNLRVAKKNVDAFRILAINIADEVPAMTTYNKLVDEGLTVILENANKKDVERLLKVFTPQRLIEFKAAMVTMFSRSVIDATTIFNLMVTYIIPRAKYNEKLIDSLISQIRLHPDGAVEEFQKLAGLITGEEVKTLAAAAQAAAKGMGWFKSKTFYTLLLGGGGCTVLFLANYMNTPDLKSFSLAVGDLKNDVLGSLEKNPNYQMATNVGTSVRDSILIQVLKQAPPEPAAVVEPRPTWSDGIMRALGYDSKKSEDRRKFAELGEKTKEVSKDILVKALLAGATAATIAIAQIAVAALFRR